MRIFIGALALLLVGAIGASTVLLLQSCGVRVPFTTWALSDCATGDQLALRTDQAAADRRTEDLTGRIAALEQDLALMRCEPPPPVTEPVVEPAPPPQTPPQTESGLAPDAFDDRDISVMEGCWQLDSDYAVRDVDTGAVTQFRDWELCFDAEGNGRETMRATNGVTCEGPIRGRITERERLVMTEPGNLQCSNRSFIFRRDITCSIDAQGRANCESVQPETNSRGRATLRRADR